MPTDIEVSSQGVGTGKMEIYSVYVVTQLSVYYSYRSCSGTTDNYSYCGSGDRGSNWIQKT